MSTSLLHGAGLGLRRELLPALEAQVPEGIGFFELAPENWMGLGGLYARRLRQLTERHAFACHGLSLSLGGPRPLDVGLLKDIRGFMDTHGIALYTEHLSWCGDEAGHLYDLLPLPLTEEAVHHAAKRIRQAQDVLGRRIGIENTSTYLVPPGAEMDEAAFVAAVVREADCLLHLDVNNVHVNSVNHGFDALAYLDALPLDRVAYMHVAGHHVKPDGLLVDTHGAEVIDPVWSLLQAAYERCGPVPTCLERDFHIPPLAELMPELMRIRQLQQQVENAPTAQRKAA
ncbi:DUF692 domain-containing protein [Aquabacterium soli]|uniref:UPF0276 protein EIP75_08320 n=1 Tax=Aquabacterium soli TaxID=2493092 RepID=A0A3R8S8S8_9BURK|nr:DUF692 domain-containing protein [Aquabacterium soli]RRS04964.1 DUF692 domain-containing protein [Aquabacterium soli]